MHNRINIDSGSPDSANLQKNRILPKQGSAVVRLLPYVLLATAIWLAPRFLLKPEDGGNNYYMTVLICVGINTILAVGLNLLMGYAGQVSLGHAAFYGLGAYISAILTTAQMPVETVGPIAVVVAIFAACAAVISLLRLESGRLAAAVGGFIVPAFIFLRFGPGHWLPYVSLAVCFAVVFAFSKVSPFKLAASYLFGGVVGAGTSALFSHAVASGGLSPWIAMAYGIFLVSLIAYLIGVQALKLHGHYLAMATLGFGVIISIIFLQWEPVTGGTSGISGIPNIQIAGKLLDNDISMYYLVWTLVVCVIALSANIVNSRIGRAFRAVHGSEVAASTLGVDTARYKVQVFVLSAALASIAGSLYAHYVIFISPEPFGFKFSVELVVMVVVGGMASIWGAIFGAGVITALGEVLRLLEQVNIGGIGIPLSDFDVVVFGLILMLIMIYVPAGLVRGTVDSVKFIIRFGRRKGKGGR